VGPKVSLYFLGKRKICFPSLDSNPDFPVHSLVTIPTTLSWLHMCYSFFILYIWPFICFCLEICVSFYSPKLSDEENVHVYGKCNNVNGHGHNYVGEFIIINLDTFSNKSEIKQNNLVN
jgi:hypothetical protein